MRIVAQSDLREIRIDKERDKLVDALQYLRERVAPVFLSAIILVCCPLVLTPVLFIFTPALAQVNEISVLKKDPSDNSSDKNDRDTPSERALLYEEIKRKRAIEKALENLQQPTKEPLVVEETEKRGPRKARMNKGRRYRLKRIKKQIAKRVAKQRAFYREQYTIDYRGEPEVRICSANINNTGVRRDVKRLLGKDALLGLIAKERAFAEAAAQARCDIVALQALLGRDLIQQQNALDRLILRLEKKGSEGWKTAIGQSHQRFSTNAFLYRSERVELLRSVSHENIRLPRFDEFRFKRFTRSPFEGVFRVSGRGGAETKTLRIFNFHFHGKLIDHVPDQEPYRMQMAETLRQMILKEEKKLDPSDPPIIVVAGDTAALRNSPSAKILEGRIVLRQFKPGGPCSLLEGHRFTCAPAPENPVTLLSLFNVQIPEKPVVFKRVVSGEEEGSKKTLYFWKPPTAVERLELRKLQIQRTTDIYMLNADLPYAQESPYLEGRYSIGVREFYNKVPMSPLVWVDLNW